MLTIDHRHSVWNNRRPKLEEQIAIGREREIEDERNERARVRLDTLVEFYNEYLQENMSEEERALMPNAFYFGRLPTIDALLSRPAAHGEPSREDFDAIIAQALVEAEQYKKDAKVAILKRLTDKLPSLQEAVDALSPDDAVQWYFAYFSCYSVTCNQIKSASFFECHAHWRAEHPHDEWLSHSPYGSERIQPLCIADWAEMLLNAAAIPLDTPQHTLDRWVREGRLYCGCGAPQLPLPQDLNFVKLASTCLPVVVIDLLHAERNVSFRLCM